MKTAAPIGDRAVLFVSILAACFLLGYTVGEAKPIPKTCPVVEGQKVITTVSDNHGQFCVYEKHRIGSSTQKARL